MLVQTLLLLNSALAWWSVSFQAPAIAQSSADATKASGGVYYVSPSGKASAAGTSSDPWDLATALRATDRVGPGSHIWIRGGVYGNGRTLFVTSLHGNERDPIIVRAVSGERAVIDGGLENHSSFTWFWGLEVMSSVPSRGPDRNAPEGVGAYEGDGLKFINLIVHDTAQGFGLWEAAKNTEAYGCLVYYNGYQGTGEDRGHGHGIYTQNLAGTKVLDDNIIFKQFGLGIQAYGSDKSHVHGYELSGNIVFENGSISRGAQRVDNILFAGPAVSGIDLQQNFTYHSTAAGAGYSRLGWVFNGSPNGDVVVQNNYWIGGESALEMWDWDSVAFTGNTLYSATKLMVLLRLPMGQKPSAYRWDRNSYYGSGLLRFNGMNQDFASWKQSTGFDANSAVMPGRPSGTWVFVRPNRYESGRANIVIYNWNQQASVGADFSSVLKPGQKFEVRDAQNVFGPPVVSGTFHGDAVQIPMNSVAVSQPVGNTPAPPVHTSVEFGAFVLISVRSSPKQTSDHS